MPINRSSTENSDLSPETLALFFLRAPDNVRRRRTCPLHPPPPHGTSPYAWPPPSAAGPPSPGGAPAARTAHRPPRHPRDRARPSPPFRPGRAALHRRAPPRAGVRFLRRLAAPPHRPKPATTPVSPPAGEPLHSGEARHCSGKFFSSGRPTSFSAPARSRSRSKLLG